MAQIVMPQTPQTPRIPQAPQAKRKLTLQDINNARDKRSVYGSLSMKEPKDTSNGNVINELSIRITDFPPGHETEKYGVDAWVKCVEPFWGKNNPRAAWMRNFVETQRVWQQPDVDYNDMKPPTGWMHLIGLHERKYTDRNGIDQVSLECIAVDLTGWYGLPEDFLPSPQQPSDEELKVERVAQKAAEQHQREVTAQAIPATTLVGDDDDDDDTGIGPF